MFPAVDMELDKHGVPVSANEDDPGIISFVTLLLTYLPGDSLKQGDSFEIKLTDKAFGYKAKGTFEKMEERDGKKYAVLTSKGEMTIQGEEVYSSIKTYYDPETKRVVFAEGEYEVPDDVFSLEISIKK